MTAQFSFPVKVYYEDTDAGGIVYYANYLRYAERARTEWLKKIGLTNVYLAENHNIYFVVKSCAIDYHAPAMLEDELIVETSIEKVGGVSISMKHTVKRGDERLVSIDLKLASVDNNKKPNKITPELMNKLKG